MKIVYAIITLLLITTSSNESKENLNTIEVLKDGNDAVAFNELIETTKKKKMVVFYSSQHCAPCLEQLKTVQENKEELDKNYQLIFVDSWTIGKAKKHQTKEKALMFYNENLATKNSVFLLDSDDKLLASYQENEKLAYALPYLVTQDNDGSILDETFKLKESIITTINNL